LVRLGVNGRERHAWALDGIVHPGPRFGQHGSFPVASKISPARSRPRIQARQALPELG